MISPYILVYVLVALLTVLSLVNKRYVNICYLFALIVLTVFLCLRYGQGTDFPAYEYTYNLAPNKLDFTNGIYFADIVSIDYGWWILNNLFKSIGVSFSGYIFVLSIAEMVLIDRFIRKMGYNRYKVFILLLAFPTVYLTYMFSALRQGLVIAIFLGVMLPYLAQKKYVRYLLMLVLISFLHKSSLILILLLFIDKISIKQLKYWLIPCFGLGLISSKLFAPIFILIGKPSYATNLSMNPFALMERIVMLGVILFLYEEYVKNSKINLSYKFEFSTVDRLLKFYLVGMCMYLAFLMFPLVASRLCIFFKLFEIWLIPQMLPCVARERRIQIFVVLLVITAGMTLKNISTSIREGNYYNDISTINYPYVTVFNKEDIRICRESQYFDINVDLNKSKF